jgi:hypothetical protein
MYKKYIDLLESDIKRASEMFVFEFFNEIIDWQLFRNPHRIIKPGVEILIFDPQLFLLKVTPTVPV